ncbi:hypothetical protein BN1002_01936 [Bacillus sp. B-jedd]|nr:hypothetical protein [Bacillus sp. B-jedd]CEG27080.1 hypothetical protein BN1002_01936 [Bacillus sp. B-jedd]
MYGWLNLGSLVLGLISWILPMINLTTEKKQDNKNWLVLSIISLFACSTSLCFQIIYTYRLVIVKDWGALEDTMYAVAYASAVLLIVTVILNLITLNVYWRKTAK